MYSSAVIHKGEVSARLQSMGQISIQTSLAKRKAPVEPAGQKKYKKVAAEAAPSGAGPSTRGAVTPAGGGQQAGVRNAFSLLQQPKSTGPAGGKLGALLTEPGWRAALLPELRKDYFAKLDAFWQAECAQGPIFPEPQNIFRAFNSSSLDNVRCVILGQDPYHGAGQAMGLSFSVPQGQPTPSSLKNIYKELKDDLGLGIPAHGDLQSWASQGVLLLNTSLTVRASQANSHSKSGWHLFTDAAIKLLSARQTGVVFLLWGRPAQQKASLVDKSKHHILMAAHPSGLSAHKGFYGCKHFSQANEYLTKQGTAPIDWQIT